MITQVNLETNDDGDEFIKVPSKDTSFDFYIGKNQTLRCPHTVIVPAYSVRHEPNWGDCYSGLHDLGSFSCTKTGEMIDHHPEAYIRYYHDENWVKYYNSYVLGNFLAWRRICIPFLLNVRTLSTELYSQYKFATDAVRRIMNGFVLYEKFPIGMLSKTFIENTVMHVNSEEEVDFLIAMATCRKFEIYTVESGFTFRVVTKMYSDRNQRTKSVTNRAFGINYDVDEDGH